MSEAKELATEVVTEVAVRALSTLRRRLIEKRAGQRKFISEGREQAWRAAQEAAHEVEAAAEHARRNAEQIAIAEEALRRNAESETPSE